MSVKRLRRDSVKELRKEKTRAELQAENMRLAAKVAALENQVEEQADALIELAGIVAGEGV